MSFLNRVRSYVHGRVLAFIVLVSVLGPAFNVAPSATQARPLAARVGCNPYSSGYVEVLDSNAWVYRYLNTDGTGDDVMYTAPKDRGFRYYGECNWYDNARNRWWVYGHSAVDSRNGWILWCHTYTSC